MPLPSRISTTSTGLLHASFAFLLLLATTASQGQADKELYGKGKKLFTGNCASCHKPDVKSSTPAPPLKGAKAKWGDKGDIYSWVKNSQGYLKSGNAMAVAIFGEYKGIMTPNAVSNEEIDAILYYADNYIPPPKKVDPSTADGPTGPRDQGGSWQWLIIVTLLLLVVVLSLGGVKNQLTNAMRERDGKEPVPVRSIWGNISHWAGNNKSWASVVGLFLFCWLIVVGWDWAFNIGVYGGDEVAHYKPEQPIAFNHKLHAGKMAINCQYCHSSAEKSKHAGIPSANVCMNCHKAVNEGTTTGKDEIAKIYAAVGWDPEAVKYTGVENPIKWVKVHNLPDHVAFSHATHVAIAKVECQKCHGPVDTEFTVAEQWAPLTMGWCIKCHSETEVPQMAASAAGTNGYYDEIHRRLTETPMGNKELQKYLEDEKITVKELGGWECAKCHY